MKYKLFLDLDGVLSDFDHGVKMATGRLPGEIPEKIMWPLIAKTKDFYAKLPWMSDGRALWNFSIPFNPVILTGLPRGNWAEPQKREWCSRELGAEVEVITCMSRVKAEKAQEITPEGVRPVLVDDRLKQKDNWESLGGLFILHTSAAESIQALKDLGF